MTSMQFILQLGIFHYIGFCFDYYIICCALFKKITDEIGVQRYCTSDFSLMRLPLQGYLGFIAVAADPF